MGLYVGDSDNLVLMLGATEVSAAYIGDTQVYPMSPFAVSPARLSFTNISLTANLRIKSPEAWTISDDSGGWLSYSASSGAAGTTTVTVTATTTSAARTATISVTTANYSKTISVSQVAILNVDWVWVENQGTGEGINLDTGIYPTVNTSFRVKYIPIRPIGSTIVGFGMAGGGTPTGSADDNSDYRFFSATITSSAYWDFNSSRLNYNILTTDSDGYITAEFGNNYEKDVTSGVMRTGSVQSSMATTGVPIYLNLSNDLKVQSLEIFESGTKVYDGHAAFDGTSYGWNDSIGGTFTTQTYGGYTMTGPSI